MIEDWTDLDLAYLLAFGEHPDLKRQAEAPSQHVGDRADAEGTDRA